MYAHSFKNCVVIVDGRPLVNFAEGDDVVTIEPRNDGATDLVGADGQMAVSISADQSATMTVRLMQTSPDNRFLQQIFDRQRAEGLFIPLMVSYRDLKTGEEGSGRGYIPRLPTMTRGAGVNTHEWTIVIEALVLNFGMAAAF